MGTQGCAVGAFPVLVPLARRGGNSLGHVCIHLHFSMWGFLFRACVFKRGGLTYVLVYLFGSEFHLSTIEFQTVYVFNVHV